MQYGKIAEYFRLSWSTLIFVLLNIATLGIFYYIWIWRFINKISTEIDKGTNRTLTIIAFSLSAWVEGVMYVPQDMSDVAIFCTLTLISVIIFIVLSFRTKNSFEQFLFKNNYKIMLNGFWCFLIPFWYQYYIAFNAEEIWQKKCLQAAPAPQSPDVSDKIDKLKGMLDTGTITEEEFEAAKKKLLS